MSKRRISLKAVIFFGGAALLLMPGLVAGSIYTGGLQERTEELLAEKLTARGEIGADQFSRRLEELWQDVGGLSRSFDIGRLDEFRRDITLFGQIDKRYSWIGVADAGGKVLAATRGLLEGESVAQRPWFRLGLQRPTATDVHEAQLLSKALGNEPLRFIDLSAPVRKPDGDVVGVFGAHVDWRWVMDTLTSLAAPGINVILLSRDQRVLFGPPNLIDKPLSLNAAIAASRTRSAALRERWPDGRDYMTVIVPLVGRADAPGFGWSLLVREDLDEALAPTRQLVRSFWMILGSSAIVALALLYLIADWVTVPLRRLVAAAQSLDTEAAARPHEETRYDEVRRLSISFIRLQTRLMEQAPGQRKDVERA